VPPGILAHGQNHHFPCQRFADKNQLPCPVFFLDQCSALSLFVQLAT